MRAGRQPQARESGCRWGLGPIPRTGGGVLRLARGAECNTSSAGWGRGVGGRDSEIHRIGWGESL